MTDLEYTLCVSNFIQYLWMKMQSLLDAKIINTQQLHRYNWQYKFPTDTTIHSPCSYCNTKIYSTEFISAVVRLLNQVHRPAASACQVS